MVEIGHLYVPGQRQPAWAELLRSRRYVVESDGAGRLRVCAPWTGGGAGQGLPTAASADAGRQAWDSAWSVLRHVVAAEQRRLTDPDAAAPPAIEVEVHPYVHHMSRTRFVLEIEPYRVSVSDTLGDGRRPPLDLAEPGHFDVEHNTIDERSPTASGSPGRRPPGYQWSGRAWAAVAPWHALAVGRSADGVRRPALRRAG